MRVISAVKQEGNKCLVSFFNTHMKRAHTLHIEIYKYHGFVLILKTVLKASKI